MSESTIREKSSSEVPISGAESHLSSVKSACDA